MKRFAFCLTLLIVPALACGGSPPSTSSIATATSATEAPITQPAVAPVPTLQNSALVDVYDPARDPAADLQQAIPIAQREGKRIMLELGGDWCIWCTYLDNFYAAHSDILQFRAAKYVLVKVNVSEANLNEAFLSQYPEAAGYPHIYILEKDGTFLHSQATEDLEDGADSYVPATFLAFLQQWAPSP